MGQSRRGVATFDKERALVLARALDGRHGMSPPKARTELVAMGASAVPLMIQSMRSQDTQVRWEAAKALGELALPEASNALVEALTDEDPSVRWVAAEGLIAIGPASLDPLLHTLMRRSGSAWLREGVHHVLSEMKMPNHAALRPILRALDSVSPSVAVLKPTSEVIEALGLEHGAQAPI
jgi:HEAT repeat protein